MKKAIIFSTALWSAIPAQAQTLKVDNFDLDSLPLAGAYCKFGEKNLTLLASDWSKKFWMKIDGKMVEFKSEQVYAEIARRQESKRWRETLTADGVTVIFDLVETGRGNDSAAFRGYIEVARNREHKHILVAGGCGA